MRTFRLAGLALVVLAISAMAGLGPVEFGSPFSSLFPGSGDAAAVETQGGSSSSPASQPASAQGSAAREAAPATGHDQSGDGHAEGEGGGHASPVTSVLLLLMVVMLAAKLGGSLMERIGQPGVLGELIFGVILGNLALVGVDVWANLMQLQIHFGAIGGGSGETIHAEKIIEILGEIGVIILLFEVGLESNVKEMMSVGASSLLVAILGVVTPFLLGWGVGAWLMPNAEIWVHIFLGATLAATSVGITARVLKDLNRLQMRESKIILGAAVIDDVLGLVILAVVMGLIQAVNTGNPMSPLAVAWIVGKALLFLVLAVVVGQWGAPHFYRLAGKLRGEHMLLTASLVILFLFSFLANRIGLATIVGAFAAGLILDPVHYAELKEREQRSLEDLIKPLAGLLVPIFFVRMGYMVDLSSFGNTSLLVFAGALTLAAFIGKQICSFGVLEKGLDRLSVGLGMVPRGEVGLIFAGIGLTLVLHGKPVINSDTYSAVVIMVIITTLVTPPALKWSLNRPRGYEGASDEEMARITAEKRQKRKDYYRSRAKDERDHRDRDSRGQRDRGRRRGGTTRGRSQAPDAPDAGRASRDETSGGGEKDGTSGSRRRRPRRRRSSGGSRGSRGGGSGSGSGGDRGSRGGGGGSGGGGRGTRGGGSGGSGQSSSGGSRSGSGRSGGGRSRSKPRRPSGSGYSEST